MDPPDPAPVTKLAAKARALAERSAIAAGQGRIDEARQGFAEAFEQGTADVRVLFLCYQFHFRIGEYDDAERLVRLRLDALDRDSDSPHTARAYANLGLVLQYRGDLDAAHVAMSRALEIDTRIGHEYGIARDLGNLSLIPEARGEYDRAEELLKQSLAIAERIGAEDIAATKLANLGDIAKARGRADKARQHWTRALAIFERIGPAKHQIEFAKKLAELDAIQTASGAGTSSAT
jgi:tetratricopeptide (TPR) repeat protein